MLPLWGCFTTFCQAILAHTVSFLVEGEPPHPRSTPWGAYRSAISCKAVPLHSAFMAWHKMSTWPSLPPHIWLTQSLTGWYLVTWLVGWLIAAGKLAGWLTAYWTKCQPEPPPRERHVAMCVTTLVTKTCGQMNPQGASSGQEQYYMGSGWPSDRQPPSRGIWWPRVVLT